MHVACQDVKIDIRWLQVEMRKGHHSSEKDNFCEEIIKLLFAMIFAKQEYN